VGSLVPTQHPDLLAIPMTRFTALAGERLEGALAYRTTRKVFGPERTVVVTYNENLLEGQLQGINAGLHKTRRKLDEIQQVLRRRQEGRVKGGQPPTVASVTAQVEKILAAQFMKK
jgi:hypothetical protein